MRIAACRSCGEPILWAEMASGKKCPFDAEPTPDGQWALDDTTHPPLAAKIAKAAGSSEPGFTCHFSTCPNADEHRVRLRPDEARRFCVVCLKDGQRTEATLLCDHSKPGGGTCDAGLCPTHTNRVRVGTDWCPAHEGEKS